jgi:hypothetical protein
VLIPLSLNSFLLNGVKQLNAPLKAPLLVKIVVKKKYGSSDGKTDTAQSLIPLKVTLTYFSGRSAKQVIKNAIISKNKILKAFCFLKINEFFIVNYIKKVGNYVHTF